MDLGKLSEILDMLETQGASQQELDDAFEEGMRQIGETMRKSAPTEQSQFDSPRLPFSSSSEDVA
ncbi:MAG: hypothetical protein SGJ20_20940 [Planctomycetota bacterium]|nr:hypothetical protein [Planctomycetota bacterium]